MLEFRTDPTTGRRVIISTERAKRPQPSIAEDPRAVTEPCPFCPGNERQTPPEVMAYRDRATGANQPGWTVRVVPNKYPAVRAEEPWVARSDGLYESAYGFGTHEVIIETPDHIANVGSLNETQLAAVLWAYRDRMLSLSDEHRWRSILIFKNQGNRAGATLEHCHSQLIALTEVPKSLNEELNIGRAYFAAARRCLYCDMVRRELSERRRWVSETEHFISFCPYAARFPYETWVSPKFHSPFFERMRDGKYAEVARCLKDTLDRLNRRLGDPALNYVIHSSSLDGGPLAYYDWHLEILPRLTQLAGFELGSGSFINTVAPEEAARLMRDAAG